MTERSRRVAFFHAYPHQYAGAQRITHAIMRALPDYGYAARLFTVDEGPFPERLREGGLDVQVVRAPAGWRRYGKAILRRQATAAAFVSLPWYWARLSLALRRWRPDVLHVNDHRAMLLAAVAGRLARVPVVWHVHGSYRSRAINRFAGILSAKIVVNSKATLAEMPILSERFGAKVVVVYNSLPPIADLSASEVAGDGAIPGTVVVCGARLHPDKGLDVLVRAASLLLVDHPDLRVVVYGPHQDGYEWHHRDLLALRAELGLEEVVSFPGSVDDPTGAWRDAAVYVQPSRVEPFGLAVLEAMAVGTPVIASATGGLREIIEDGRSGLLVPPEDSAALAAAIDRALTDPALAARLSAGGRRRAEDDFSEERMMTRLVTIYREVASARE